MGFWQFATGGGSGGGTGDVVGPASSTDNAIARFDGATGKLLQDSAVTVSDVAAGVVTLATTAGNALAIKNTDPAATTGASVAGDPLTITAGAAVASTDTAGAAAGGSVTITAGAAARNTSGNANGGDVLLVGGAGIGTGTQGVVKANGTAVVVGSTGSTDNAILRADGTGGATLQNSPVTIADTTGMIATTDSGGLQITSGDYVKRVSGAWTVSGVGGVMLSVGAFPQAFFSQAGGKAAFPSDVSLNFSSVGTASFGTASAIDVGLARSAAGVVKVTDGSTGIRGLLGGGTSVASASALPVPTGRVFHVTGTTAITSITSTNFQAGAVITLIFDDVLTFTDGNNLKLAGDFTTSADDTITLAYDGTNWYECSRSVN